MPLPRRLARFNRIATNRVGLRVAAWAPGFAVIEYRGRVTGRRYRTPVAAFVKGGAFTIALTYGPGSEWVKNLVAAGRCDAQSRGRRLRLTDPRVVHDEQRRPVPVPVRWALRLLGAADFLQASIVPLVGEHDA